MSSRWFLHSVLSLLKMEPAVTEEFQLPVLISWTELPNDTLKKNMGTARYKIQFDFQKDNGKEYRLCLDDVRESTIWSPVPSGLLGPVTIQEDNIISVN